MSFSLAPGAKRRADFALSSFSLGSRHHSPVEGHPHHHRGPHRPTFVGSSNRDEDPQRQGGRHSLQMARREFLLSISVQSDKLTAPCDRSSSSTSSTVKATAFHSRTFATPSTGVSSRPSLEMLRPSLTISLHRNRRGSSVLRLESRSAHGGGRQAQ